MDDYGFNYLIATRLLRSVALIYTTIAMPLYLLALHIKIEYIGLIVAVVILFNIFISFLASMLGDRIGYKYSLITVEAVSFLGVLIIALTSNYYLIILGLVLAGTIGGSGAARGSMSAGLTAFIANNWKDGKTRARKIALVLTLGAIGSVMGSALLYFNAPLVSYVGAYGAYKVGFAIAAVMLLASLLLLTKIRDSKRPAKTTKVMKTKSFRYSLRVMASNMFGGMGVGIALPLIPLWFALSFHVGTTQLSYIFMAYYGMGAVGAFAASRIARRFNLINLGAMSRLTGGIILMAMAFSPFIILAAVLFLLYAIISTFGAAPRMVVNLAGLSNEDYGAATTLQGASIRVPQIASGLSGYALDYALPAPLFIGGLLYGISGVLYKKLMTDPKAKKAAKAE